MFPAWEESPESQAGVHYRFPRAVGNGGKPGKLGGDRCLRAGQHGLDLQRLSERVDRLCSLAELELSVRATNCLETEGIETVRQLVVRNDDELLEIRNFGDSTLREVKAKLALHGLSLGMKL